MTYYRRSAWGARRAARGTLLRVDEVQGLALHWPGSETRYPTVEAVKAALRAFQADHMDDNGWRDIAYQEAVDQDGNVYRLRGLRYVSAANGDTGPNQHYGAVLLMLGIGEDPSPAMIAAVRRVVRRHRNLFPKSGRIVPHSAIRPEPTACPGDKVRALIAAGRFNPLGK